MVLKSVLQLYSKLIDALRGLSLCILEVLLLTFQFLPFLFQVSFELCLIYLVSLQILFHFFNTDFIPFQRFLQLLDALHRLITANLTVLKS